MHNHKSDRETRVLGATGILIALLLATITGYYAGSLSARQAGISVKPLLKTTQTITGQTITYPTTAPAQITEAIVTVEPGAKTGWHTHPVPLFGYILEGEIRVDYGNDIFHVYRAGDALMETIDRPHNGHNVGVVPVKILSLFIGAKGIRDSISLKHQQNSIE